MLPRAAPAQGSAPTAGYSAGVRDALYRMSRSERRGALAAWRHLGTDQRRQALGLAPGAPSVCADPELSRTAHRYGQYLLQDTFPNRVPRSLLSVLGALLAVGGLCLWAGLLGIPDGRALGVLLTAGGVVVLVCGLLGWSQRRWGRLLVSAHRPEGDLDDPRR